MGVRDNSITFEAVKIAMTQDKNGHVLRLAIHPNDSPEDVLRHPVGTRYMVALVEIDEHGQDVPPKSVMEGEKAVKIAGAMCSNSEFQEWLVLLGYADDIGEEFAAAAVREWCGISSRAELKTNRIARERFNDLVSQFKAKFTQR